METTKFKVREVFFRRLLGSAPASKEIYQQFILNKRQELEARKQKKAELTGKPVMPTPGNEAEELDTLNEDSGVTQFHNDLGQTDEDGNPGKGIFLYDYQVAGFWKESAEALAPKFAIAQVRSKLDLYMQIEPRRVYIHGTDGNVRTKADFTLERPLRAKTMRGDRVTLAASEVFKEGIWIEYSVDFMPLRTRAGKDGKLVDLDRFVEEVAWYAGRHGHGQWRNGGNGKAKMTTEAVIEKEEVIDSPSV